MIIQLKDKKNMIASARDVEKILRALLMAEDQVDRDKEHFWVFHLDTRHRIKVLELASLGILNAALVHPREIFTRSIANRCSAILVAHNHPSDDPRPSPEDVSITMNLKEAGVILDIPLVDHVIIGEDGYHSFKEHGFV